MTRNKWMSTSAWPCFSNRTTSRSAAALIGQRVLCLRMRWVPASKSLSTWEVVRSRFISRLSRKKIGPRADPAMGAGDRRSRFFGLDSTSFLQIAVSRRMRGFSRAANDTEERHFSAQLRLGAPIAQDTKFGFLTVFAQCACLNSWTRRRPGSGNQNATPEPLGPQGHCCRPRD